MMTEGTAYAFFRSFHSSAGIGRTLIGIRQGVLNGMKLEPEPNIPKELRLDACPLRRISSVMETGAFVFDVTTGLYLKAGISGFRADGQLVAMAQEWQGRGANYFMRATLPHATNEKTAEELGVVMNILYSGWIIAGKTEDDPNPIAEVFREKNGAYVSARLEPPAG